MAKKLNSAYRIHKILSSINHQSTSPTLDVWALAFEIKETNRTKLGLQVAHRLACVFNELTLMQKHLQKSDFEEDTYRREIGNIEVAIDPSLLNTNWNSVSQYLTPVVIKSLLIFSQSLPNEETEITSDEINELFARLSELESFLENSTLPERLITLIIRHIALIREALYEYPIAGEKALHEAIRYAKGEFLEVKDLIENNKAKLEVQKVCSIWGDVYKYVKRAKEVKDAYEVIEPVWTFIAGLLPPS